MFSRNLLQEQSGSIQKDLKAIMDATSSLGEHTYEALGFSLGISSFLQWLALATGIYLFVIDRTNWRTNVLTALLVPYVALNLPVFLLNVIRGQIGYWAAFIFVVLRLFFPKHFPDHAELPASLIVLLVVAPAFIIKLRFNIYGTIISLGIGFYLLYEHIISAGGVRKAFEQRGVPMTIGIILLFVSPAWEFFTFVF